MKAGWMDLVIRRFASLIAHLWRELWKNELLFYLKTLQKSIYKIIDTLYNKWILLFSFFNLLLRRSSLSAWTEIKDSLNYKLWKRVVALKKALSRAAAFQYRGNISSLFSKTLCWAKVASYPTLNQLFGTPVKVTKTQNYLKVRVNENLNGWP